MFMYGERVYLTGLGNVRLRMTTSTLDISEDSAKKNKKEKYYQNIHQKKVDKCIFK